MILVGLTGIRFETNVVDSTTTRLAADELDALVLAAALVLATAMRRVRRDLRR